MTRDEAISKLESRANFNAYVADDFVDGLAALGLLKLEEPKPEWHKDVVLAVRKYPGLVDVSPINVICALEHAGLKVVRA